MYSRYDLRRKVFDLLDWSAEEAPENVRRVNRHLNTAMRRICADAPGALFTAEERLFLTADYKSADPNGGTDTISISPTDSWVFKRDALRSSFTVDNRWNLTQKWDARTLLVQDSSGTWQTRQIRSVFEDGSGYECISLVEPWPNLSDTGLKYMIDLNRTVWLAGEVKQLKSLQTVQGTTTFPLRPIPRPTMEIWRLYEPQPVTNIGYPDQYCQAPPFRLDPPAMTPNPALTGTNSGSLNLGTHQYRFTFVWGKRNIQDICPSPDAGDSNTNRTSREVPLFESPPSPESAEITRESGDPAISFRVPALWSILKFDDPTQPRYGEVGLRCRIYRKSINFAAGAAATIPEQYYFLDEVEADGGIYADDGSIGPDTLTPLQPHHAYTGVMIVPRPAGDYVLSCYYMAHVLDMTDDSQVPPLTHDGCEALSYSAASEIATFLGQRDLAMRLQARYKEIVSDITKTNASIYPKDRPTKRALAGGMVNRGR